MSESPFVAKVVFHVGPVPITEPVVTTWVLLVVFGVGCYFLTRNLGAAGRRQSAAEVIVSGLVDQISEVISGDGKPFLSLLGAIFLFIVAANFTGLVPGAHAPTASLETTGALAVTVFFAVHGYGIQKLGVKGYLKTFAHPTPLMAPFHVLTQFTRTFSLMVRLFGNVMSGEFVIAIVFALAGLFVPLPLMILEVLLGTVQAYIFTTLAALYLGAAVGSFEGG